MFLLRTRPQLDLHSENAQEEPEQQMSGAETFDHLTRGELLKGLACTCQDSIKLSNKCLMIAGEWT